MMVAAFSVSVGDATNAATIAIPADILVRQLGDANPVTRVADARRLVEAQLASVPVGVSLQLNPLTVTPAQIIRLAVGDIVGLPHDKTKPLNVAVEGRPMARASIGTTGSRIACVVVETQENPR
jgi:flagellar motor switch protein FliM